MINRLGISIYPEKAGEKATFQYLENASKNGFTRVFANLLEIKNDQDGKDRLEMYKRIFNYCQKLKMIVILDVAPSIYKTFNLKPTEIDFFINLGVNGIRLDSDFGGEVEAQVSHNDRNFLVEINASISTKLIQKIISHRPNLKNIIACHNFYPMLYSGLKYERFCELSGRFKELGIKVAAFVTLEDSKSIGPWNINDKMPTIEEHRSWPLLEQVQHFLSLKIVDDIIISQQGTSLEEFQMLGQLLKYWNKINQEELISLKINFEKDVSVVEKEIVKAIAFEKKLAEPQFEEYQKDFGKLHINRHDNSSYFIRSTISRVLYSDQSIKPRLSGKQLFPGDVVVLNDNFKRYKGEVHIILRPIDDRKFMQRNLVGKIAQEDLYKLQSIDGGRKFKFYD